MPSSNQQKQQRRNASDSAARQRKAQNDELAAADLAGRAGLMQAQKLIEEKAANLAAAELTGELRFKLRLEEEGESVDAST